MNDTGVGTMLRRARAQRRRWRRTAYEHDPVRSDVVVVEGLAAICTLCAVLYGLVFVWVTTDSDYDVRWWVQSYNLVVAAVAGTTLWALHTPRATWLYRHTDTVTTVAALLILLSPVIGNADAGVGFPAFGLALSIVAAAALLQHRSHMVAVVTLGVAAWIALAVAYGTGVSVSTFSAAVIRTVVVTIVIHYVRSRTIDLLWERYRSVDEARRRADSLSHHDDLTGLFNRRGLARGAAAALEQGDLDGVPVGVLYLDVDELKEINDRDGHDAGDTTLIRVADVLRESLRPADVIARVGGDEFVVVVTGIDGDDVVDLGARVLTRLSEIGISASVGIAVWRPGPDSPDLDELMRRADSAMYREKFRR